jgi:ABC-2 type transport system permease protein
MTAPTIRVADQRVGSLRQFGNVLASEACKLRSVRSSAWALLTAITFNVGLAALLAIFLPDALSAYDKATLDTTRVSLGGLHLSQVACGLLGVLAISSEYTTGLIRTTLSAVPDRRLLLAAKTLVLAAAVAVVATASCLAAYYSFELLLADHHLRTSLADPGVLRAVLGGGLYLTAVALLGLGLGAALRSSAGAIATLLGLLLIPPLLLELLPNSWKTAATPYTPLDAGSAIVSVHQDPGSLGPWGGFGLFCAYTLLSLVAGFILINHRDA